MLVQLECCFRQNGMFVNNGIFISHAVKFCFNSPFLSIFRWKSRYEEDLSVSVVSFDFKFNWGSTYSPNLELFRLRHHLYSGTYTKRLSHLFSFSLQKALYEVSFKSFISLELETLFLKVQPYFLPTSQVFIFHKTVFKQSKICSIWNVYEKSRVI